MFVETIKTGSLSNNSYVIGSEVSGKCVVIDPVRDVDQYIEIASHLNTNIEYALETHLHNDFISGSLELASKTNCKIGVSSAGGTLFPSISLKDGDILNFEDFTLRVLHTPGHTPEHISFLAEMDGVPTALFSGGALMRGGAARVDLVGKKIAPFLAKWLHKTLHEKILMLPDDVNVYPTHGGGSFCSSGTSYGTEDATTIGEEKQFNPLAAEPKEASFIELALADLGTYPTYFSFMADINRKGPEIYGRVSRGRILTPDSIKEAIEGNTYVIDAREFPEFISEHIQGSFGIPFGEQFSTWIGWLIPWNSPLMVISPDKVPSELIARQLMLIGFDQVVVSLRGGIRNWKSAGFPTESSTTISSDLLLNQLGKKSAPMIFDVRQHKEFVEGHVENAINVELGELSHHLEGIPREQSIVTVCASGMRASIASSILLRDGRKDITILDSGTQNWIDQGYPTETGP